MFTNAYHYRNREVLLLTAAFSLSQGVLGVWLGVMNVMIEMNTNLTSIGLSQVRQVFHPYVRLFPLKNYLFTGAKRLVRFLGHTC